MEQEGEERTRAWLGDRLWFVPPSDSLVAICPHTLQSPMTSPFPQLPGAHHAHPHGSQAL